LGKGDSQGPTIFVAYGLADGDGSLLVGVLDDEDLGQLDAQTVGDELGESRMAVAGQEFYRVRGHYASMLVTGRLCSEAVAACSR
jgi:hypothetical protein